MNDYHALRRHFASPRPLPARTFRRLSPVFLNDPIVSGTDFIAEFNALVAAAGQLTPAATVGLAYRLWEAIIGPPPVLRAHLPNHLEFEGEARMEEAVSLVYEWLYQAWSAQDRGLALNAMRALEEARFQEMDWEWERDEPRPLTLFVEAISSLWNDIVFNVSPPEPAKITMLMVVAIGEALASGYLQGGYEIVERDEFKVARFEREQLAMLVCEPALRAGLRYYGLYDRFYLGDINFYPPSAYLLFGPQTEGDGGPGVFTLDPGGTWVPFDTTLPGWVAAASERDGIAFDLTLVRDQMWARLALIRRELAATVPFHYDPSITTGTRKPIPPDNPAYSPEFWIALAEARGVTAVSGFDDFRNRLGVPQILEDHAPFTRGRVSKPEARRREERWRRLDADRERKTEAARAAYEMMLADGRLRLLGRLEQLKRTAEGHPDNESTQAARRILKRQYDLDWPPAESDAVPRFDENPGLVHGRRSPRETVGRRTTVGTSWSGPLLYHVTPTDRLPAIMNEGLVPRIEKRGVHAGGERVPAVYVYTTLEDVHDGIVNWYGDEIDEATGIAILEIDPDPSWHLLEDPELPGVAYRLLCAVPPKRIRVHSIED